MTSDVGEIFFFNGAPNVSFVTHLYCIFNKSYDSVYGKVRILILNSVFLVFHKFSLLFLSVEKTLNYNRNNPNSFKIFLGTTHKP